MCWLTLNLWDAAEKLVGRAAEHLPLLDGGGQGEGGQGEQDQEQGHHGCLHSGERRSWLFFVAWRSSRVWCKHSLGTFYIHPAVRWPEARHRDAKACYLLRVISLLGILKIWRGRQTLRSRYADQARVKVFCRRCCLGKELIVIQFLSFSSEIPTKDMRECTSIQLLSVWWNCTIFIQHLFKQGFWDACLPLTPFFT